MLHNLFYTFFLLQNLFRHICCICILVLIIFSLFFTFQIFDSFFFAFIHRCNTFYAFKRHIKTTCGVMYHTFVKHVFYRSPSLETNLALVAWRYIKYLGCRKKSRYWYFEKIKSYGKTVFFPYAPPLLFWYFVIPYAPPPPPPVQGL